MSGLARWCFQHRRWVAAGWLLAMVAVVGLGRAAGTDFGSSFSLPNTDSQAAVSLLTQNFPAASGEGDQIVIQATHGATIRSAPVRAEVTAALAKVAAVPGVEAVASPYAKAGAAQISRDGRLAFAVVTWDKQAAQVTSADANHLIKAAESADGPTVRISLSGQSITNSERPDPGFTVAVGVIAALAVLLVVFGGALLAALLPLLGAIVALVLGNSLIGLLSHAMSISSVSTELAVLIGLGVGVDYGLFIISRYRSAVKQGASYSDAAQLAVATSGRTVVLAGLTVCIALLGQFLLGVSFLYGVSVSAAVAVALTMATALTLLPAMLGFLGPRVLSRRERRALATGRHASPAAGGFWLRWARFVEARKVLVAVGSLAAVAAIALPDLRPAARHLGRQHRPGQLDQPPGLHRPGRRVRARLQRAARAGRPVRLGGRRHRLRPAAGRRGPHARGGIGGPLGHLTEREGPARHRLPDHQPAGRADHQPGEQPA